MASAKEIAKKREINPYTGTRFVPGSAADYAMKFIIKSVKSGMCETDKIKKGLSLIRRENGYRFNLDSTYLLFCCKCHPEFITVNSKEGTVTLHKEPEPDRKRIAMSKNIQDSRANREMLKSEVKKQRKEYGV